MASSNGRHRGGSTLDRFQTHKELVNDIARIKDRGGLSAVVAAFVLWDWANAFTGRVKVSVSGLAAVLNADRKTARTALKALEDLGIIQPDGDGWVMPHTTKTADDDTRCQRSSNDQPHEV